MPIRIKCSDHAYRPPNVAYIYQRQDGGWGCVLANGVPAAMSYAGIGGDEMGLKFELEDARTEEDALTTVLRHARRYLSGPRQGETVYTYELFSTAQRKADYAADVLRVSPA